MIHSPTDGTVNDLVVEATGDDDLLIPLGNGALGGLDGDSDLANGADGQDTGLRGVDDGSEALNRGVHAHVADGEGAALVLLGLELVVTSTLAQVADLVGDAGQTEPLDTLNNRGDQAGGGGNGNADVNGVVLADDSLAVLLDPAGVDLGHLHEGGGTGLDEEVIDGQLVLAVSGGVQSLAQLEKLGDREGGGDEVVGVLGHRLLQAVGDSLAHRGDGKILKGGGGGSSGLVLLHILLGDLATLAGTLDGLEGNTLLESQSLGSVADVGLTVQAGLQLLTGGLRLLSGGLRGRGRGGRLSALGSLLLGRGSLLTTGISQGERLKGRDVGTLLNKDGNGLIRGRLARGEMAAENP